MLTALSPEPDPAVEIETLWRFWFSVTDIEPLIAPWIERFMEALLAVPLTAPVALNVRSSQTPDTVPAA